MCVGGGWSVKTILVTRMRSQNEGDKLLWARRLHAKN